MNPNNAHLQFWIELDHGKLQYRFLVNYQEDEQSEYFELQAGPRRLMITSNRPTLRKQGNHAIPEFLLQEGGITKPGLLLKVFEALDEYVEENL
ncbi:hypothetical protein [Flavisolibacter tropicus]|uniref:Uncharacterized protein n=1 Tax=Flavisolibacter tropicus TaxID=1492898 RepID=A0A172TYW3_9BACT|nr:hypothetical protein [Flavisolibacter tropicus]ANE52172.1 hypothetical protein SY85_18405 [Flavisolibacter tropicus]